MASVVGVEAARIPTVASLSTGTIGAIGELIAAADLMRRGYHVFRALSPNCPSDLLVYRGGTSLRVQVRSARLSEQNTRVLQFPLKPHDEGTFDVLALVLDTKEVYYLPRIHGDGPKCPYLVSRTQLAMLQQWGVLRGRPLVGPGMEPLEG